MGCGRIPSWIISLILVSGLCGSVLSLDVYQCRCECKCQENCSPNDDHSTGSFDISKERLHLSCNFSDIPLCQDDTKLDTCGPFTECCWRILHGLSFLDCETGFKRWCNTDNSCVYHTTLCVCESIVSSTTTPEYNEIDQDLSCGSQTSTSNPHNTDISGPGGVASTPITLTTTGQTGDDDTMLFGIMIGVGIGVIVLLIVIVIALLLYCRRQGKMEGIKQGKKASQIGLTMVDITRESHDSQNQEYAEIVDIQGAIAPANAYQFNRATTSEQPRKEYAELNMSERRPNPQLNMSERRPNPQLNMSESSPNPQLNMSERRPNPQLNMSESRPNPLLNMSDRRPNPVLHDNHEYHEVGIANNAECMDPVIYAEPIRTIKQQSDIIRDDDSAKDCGPPSESTAVATEYFTLDGP